MENDCISNIKTIHYVVALQEKITKACGYGLFSSVETRTLIRTILSSANILFSAQVCLNVNIDLLKRRLSCS